MILFLANTYICVQELAVKILQAPPELRQQPTQYAESQQRLMQRLSSDDKADIKMALASTYAYICNGFSQTVDLQHLRQTI